MEAAEVVEAAEYRTPEERAAEAERFADLLAGLRDMLRWLEGLSPAARKMVVDSLYSEWIHAALHVSMLKKPGEYDRVALARIVRELGGRFEKDAYGGTFALRRSFGGSIKVIVYAERDSVCIRKLAGVDQQPVRVIPPEREAEAEKLRAQLEALEVERTVETERYEWDCPSVLGG